MGIYSYHDILLKDSQAKVSTPLIGSISLSWGKYVAGESFFFTRVNYFFMRFQKKKCEIISYCNLQIYTETDLIWTFSFIIQVQFDHQFIQKRFAAEQILKGYHSAPHIYKMTLYNSGSIRVVHGFSQSVNCSCETFVILFILASFMKAGCAVV